MRREVYPRRISSGKMTASLAQSESAKMEAIHEHLRILAEAEAKADDLFGEGNGRGQAKAGA
jgi:hypothetical protein